MGGEDLTNMAGWIAPTATMLAAVMTASNLGARVTGWGFAVFTVGSICWSIVGAASGQANLLWTNGFLTLVNGVGIWRWLGRQARYEEGGRLAVEASKASPAPTLLTASSLIEMDVLDQSDNKIGSLVDAMLDCKSQKLQTIILRRGGIAGVGERLIAISADAICCGAEHIQLSMQAEEVDGMPDWRP
ncbi:PRC-barrel domain-containing protein [Sphingobium sp. AP50]|uniref:PRC-barrel domain-containing protein n=1 Tax=Sphingobium rhizovicinum TaxID=432308 RepID=A0ABV7NKI6_9SPHN|nr:PRC-barrel domain-containing protein [Sphingobium sp. AP50]SEJ97835.1 PRC-barrel domain-containing protein [Sphingobium sp. AP50]